ncbi:heavy metal translocating P-type ATPase [Desulfurococcus mucosus]|nr:heavy metal translocating P-type ATPase [Desulfurococcus mucosus]
MRRREPVEIIGVDCSTCIYAIKRRLADLRGNVKLESDFLGNAVIEYDDEYVSLSEIYHAIRDAGYDLVKEELEVFAEEIQPETAVAVEKEIRRLPGILDVRVDTLTCRILVRFNPRTVEKHYILSLLDNMGLSLREEPRGGRGGTKAHIARRFAAFATGLTVLIISMSHILPHDAGIPVLLALSSLTVLLSYDVFLKGFKSLFMWAPTMESLIALSAGITFVSGILLCITGSATRYQAMFLEASAGVLGFVNLGRYLEDSLRKRALTHLTVLETSLNSKVRVVEDGRVEEVSADAVSLNSIIEVKAGEKILVDGIVVDGWGYVDESTFTGEPIPVLKSSENRDRVLAGTILTSGYIRVRVTRKGRDTALYNLLASAREAVLHRPGFQQLADKAVGKLTWIVTASALVTVFSWYIYSGDIFLSLLFAASVLAVSCPCPLGIAIPMVVSIGVIKASREGILVKKGDVFERIPASNILLLDKTGTITVGKPSLKGVVTLGGYSREEIMKYVCSVEQRSEHPLARAISNYCRDAGVSVEDPEFFEHLPGLGVLGVVMGKRVGVGSINLVKGLGVEINSGTQTLIDEIGRSGGTPVLVVIGDEVAAVLEIRDEVREDALNVVKYFKSVGFKVGIASGDIEENVKHVGKELGLDFFYSGLRPEDKGRLIHGIQGGGQRVLYVGDGVNDAIALSAAFVGIAVGNATDIARESGDAILLRDSLETMITLHKLSKRVLRKARENLAWAFIYNGVLIPVAAGVLYPFNGLMLMPEMAALAMILSDVTVILNSLSLLWWKP